MDASSRRARLPLSKPRASILVERKSTSRPRQQAERTSRPTGHEEGGMVRDAQKYNLLCVPWLYVLNTMMSSSRMRMRMTMVTVLTVEGHDVSFHVRASTPPPPPLHPR